MQGAWRDAYYRMSFSMNKTPIAVDADFSFRKSAGVFLHPSLNTGVAVFTSAF
jgi:hypothetical protein